MSEQRTATLGELLKPEQLKEVLRLLNLGDFSMLRTYLNSIETDLTEQGVVPEYLYYKLLYQLRK